MLHKLRQKTEYQKRKIALTVSILLTGLMFIVWLSTTIHSFSALNSDNEGGEISKSADSPFTLVKDSVATVYESMKKNVGQLNNQVSE